MSLPSVIDNVGAIVPAIRAGERVCLVEGSDDYPGELLFQVFPTELLEEFVHEHSRFLSPYCILSELFMLDVLTNQLLDEGWNVVALPSAAPIIEQFVRWAEPLKVDGLILPDGLHPFQQFSLRRAFDARGGRAKVNGFFFNWGTGTGKSVAAAAGMQELLVNRDEIDLCLFFTLRRLRINMSRQVTALTGMEAEVIEGTKTRRQRRYDDSEAPCLVLNYEKAHFDAEELQRKVTGKRVLFVFDEVQKIVRGENDATRARKAIDVLLRATEKSLVWPMSASIVKASPLRYHNIFELLGKNPLGTRKDFVARYCTRIEDYQLRPGVILHNYVWNKSELTEVRHRVSAKTQAVRKTDPGVREFFKGMQTLMIPVQHSPEERKLISLILDDAEMSTQIENDFSFVAHYNCIRYACNTPAALRYSESEVAQRIVQTYPRLIDAPSSKFEMVCDKIEDIREQGDQVIVFTHYTYLCLFLLAKVFHERGIRYVTHYGTGMSDKDAQTAQDSFKSSPEITVFLSSDAGASGLNFQNARFVINVECPYDYDTLMQRNDRIDRADSYLEGLTSYIYVVEDSVEERIWKINQERMALSASTQGTHETLSRTSEVVFAQGLFRNHRG